MRGAFRTVPWRIAFAHLRRAWFRTSLTVGGVALAIFLLCTLRTVITSFASTVESAGRSRVITSSAVSLFRQLPKKIEGEIRSMPGVRQTTHWTWFGGVWRDADSFFARFAVDVPSMRAMYGDRSVSKEIVLPAEAWDAFEQTRRGCVVGAGLARQYGFKVGDRIPMVGNIWPGDYEFDVVGIYASGSPQFDEVSLFFHWTYLDETVGRKGTVSLFIVEIEPGYDMGDLTERIDARFESSDHRTRTLTEAAFNQQFVSMWGNVPALLAMIGGAVLFASFMIALNPMLLNARERRTEVGVLKALGFPDRSVFLLVVTEGILTGVLGGLLGTAGAVAVFNWMGVDALYRFFPSFEITDGTCAIGFATGVGVGLVSGLVPAIVLRRMKVMDALQRIG